MSAITKNSLKPILLQLECHFTWTLRKEDVHLDELERAISEQIRFLIRKSKDLKYKVAYYNILAYVKHLKGKSEEALRNLQKAEEEVQADHGDD
uniref:Uncharacterized protein n=1 Tax=Sphenodon punctatus TaxID=8508 RepID=A0A8D0G498_SPHPU